MSKDFYTSDGSQITVNDSGQVFGPNGYMGQVNQFGDFVSGDNYYNINQFGEISSSDGKFAGKIIYGNEIMIEKRPETTSENHSTGSSSVSVFSSEQKKKIIMFLVKAGIAFTIFIQLMIISIAVLSVILADYDINSNVLLVICALVNIIISTLLMRLISCLLNRVKEFLEKPKDN